MRLTKLALVSLLIALCSLGLAQNASKPTDAPVVVPPHTPTQLMSELSYPWTHLNAFTNPPPVPFPWYSMSWIRLPDRTLAYAGSGVQVTPRPKQPSVDRGINIFPQIASAAPNTCFKLRKYVFEPPQQTQMNGVRPLGNQMQMVGQTDCTYASRVSPKSVDKLQPPKPNVEVQSTVFKPE